MIRWILPVSIVLSCCGTTIASPALQGVEIGMPFKDAAARLDANGYQCRTFASGPPLLRDQLDCSSNVGSLYVSGLTLSKRVGQINYFFDSSQKNQQELTSAIERQFDLVRKPPFSTEAPQWTFKDAAGVSLKMSGNLLVMKADDLIIEEQALFELLRKATAPPKF